MGFAAGGEAGVTGARAGLSVAAIPARTGVFCAGAVATGAWLLAISPRNAAANWLMSCAATLWIMPEARPYCATEPDRLRSVSIRTFVPSETGKE